MKKKITYLVGACIAVFCLIIQPVSAMSAPEKIFAQSSVISDSRQILANNDYVFLRTSTEVYIYSTEDMNTPLTSISADAGASVKLQASNMILKDNYLIISFLRNSGYGNPFVGIYDVSFVEQGQSFSTKYRKSLQSVGAYYGAIIAKSGDILFLRDAKNERTEIYNIGNLNSSFSLLGSIADFVPSRMEIDGDYMFAAFSGNDTAFSLYNITTLAESKTAAAAYIGRVGRPVVDGVEYPVVSVVKKDSYVMMSTNLATGGYNNGIFIYDISGIESGAEPLLLSVYRARKDVAGSRINTIRRNGNTLYVSAQDQNTLIILDISQPNNVQIIKTLSVCETNLYGYDIFQKDNLLYVCDRISGINVFLLPKPLVSELTVLNNNTELRTLVPGSIKAGLSFENYVGDNKINGELILALYNGERLVDLVSKQINTEAGYGVGEFLTPELEVTDAENTSVKAFFIDSFNTLMPVALTRQLRKAFDNPPKAYYVDGVSGNDENDGSEAAPFQTIERAKDAVRSINNDMLSDIHVYIKGGLYKLTETLEFTESDSGFNGFRVIYQSVDGEKPIISGGKEINNWTLYDAENNIYCADADGIDNRHLFVNGRRAVRARSNGDVLDFVNDGGVDGFTCANTELLTYNNITDVEFVFKKAWVSRRVHPLAIEALADGRVQLSMSNWSDVNDLSYKAPDGVYYYENAYELLDREGEFFIDKANKKAYYKPLSGENMETAQVLAPVLETLVSVKGKNSLMPARNISFYGLELSDSTWTSPNYNDFIDSQNLRPEKPMAAVQLDNASNIVLERCTITRVGGDALAASQTVRDCDIIGNTIYDISARGIHLGDWDVARDTNNEHERLSGFTIKNNYIHAIGEEYYSATAISAGFISDSQISHNEICDVPYSGIHIGWAGDAEKSSIKNLKIEYNYIHDYMHTCADGGAIYFMGMTGGSTENMNLVYRNYLKNSGNGTTAVLYCDTASDYYHMKENVIDNSQVPWNGWYGMGADSVSRYNLFTDNYSTTGACTPIGNENFQNTKVYPYANWPEEAEAIINSAGLEEGYKDILKKEKVQVQFELVGRYATDNSTNFMCVGNKYAFVMENETDISVYNAENSLWETPITHISLAIPNSAGAKYKIQAVEVLEESLLVSFSGSAAGKDSVIAVYDIAAIDEATAMQPDYQYAVPSDTVMLKNDDYLILGEIQSNLLKLYSISGVAQRNFVLSRTLEADCAEEMYVDNDYLYVIRSEIIDIYYLSDSNLFAQGSDADEAVKMGTIPITSEGFLSLTAANDILYVATALPTGINRCNLLLYDMDSLSAADTDGSEAELIGDYKSVDYDTVVSRYNGYIREVSEQQNDKFIFERSSSKTQINVYTAAEHSFVTSIKCTIPNKTEYDFKIATMCLKDDKLIVYYHQNSGYGNQRISVYDVSDISENETLEVVSGFGVRANNGLVFKNDNYVFYTDPFFQSTYVCSLDAANGTLKKLVTLNIYSMIEYADNDYLYVYNSTADCIEIYSLADLPLKVGPTSKIGICPASAERLTDLRGQRIYPAKAIFQKDGRLYASNSGLYSIDVLDLNGSQNEGLLASLKLYDSSSLAGIYVYENMIYALTAEKELLIYRVIEMQNN